MSTSVATWGQLSLGRNDPAVCDRGRFLRGGRTAARAALCYDAQRSGLGRKEYGDARERKGNRAEDRGNCASVRSGVDGGRAAGQFADRQRPAGPSKGGADPRGKLCGSERAGAAYGRINQLQRQSAGADSAGVRGRIAGSPSCGTVSPGGRFIERFSECGDRSDVASARMARRLEKRD